MSENKDDMLAFPALRETNNPDLPLYAASFGMSLRAYAAIKLRQPDSGIDWLDDMIAKAKRDELAAMAMQGHCANTELASMRKGELAAWSYGCADAMLAARKEQPHA